MGLSERKEGSGRKRKGDGRAGVGGGKRENRLRKRRTVSVRSKQSAKMR